MLCVSAVNPVLFSKVPALLHVMSVRKRIAAMFPYLRCPFRGSIQRGLGFRRHLLESNDFFALRDLVDLSKGVFAGKPTKCILLFINSAHNYFLVYYTCNHTTKTILDRLVRRSPSYILCYCFLVIIVLLIY